VSGSRVRDRRDQSPGAAEPVIRGLSKEHTEAWRRRRVPYLEQVTEASLGKPSSALRILQSWAQSEGLQPRETIYVSWTPSRHRLRFTKTGEENLERAYRTHWISPGS
jgi:hypothetical protein